MRFFSRRRPAPQPTMPPLAEVPDDVEHITLGEADRQETDRHSRRGLRNLKKTFAEAGVDFPDSEDE